MNIGREKSIIDVRSFIETFSLKLSAYFGEDILKINCRNFRGLSVTTIVDEITAVLFECCYFIIKNKDDRKLTVYLESQKGAASFVFKLDKAFLEYRRIFEKIFDGFEESYELIEEDEFFNVKITISNKKKQVKTLFVASDEDDIRWNFYAKRSVEKIDEWIEQFNQ